MFDMSGAKLLIRIKERLKSLNYEPFEELELLLKISNKIGERYNVPNWYIDHLINNLQS